MGHSVASEDEEHLMRIRLSPLARLSLVAAFVMMTSLSAVSVRAQQPAPVQPGTRWTDEQLRQGIELARVGRKLTPKSWPNQSRVAVCLSFDTDTEAPLLRDGSTSPTTLSSADFGAEGGVPRIRRVPVRHPGPGTV